jgi:aquaporin Z
MSNTQRLGAEAFGTFWLVLGGCGTAVLAGAGVGTLGISFAFGLTVLTMAFAVGHISGGHFNPAVTVGLWVGRRFESRDVAPYVVAQLIGAVLAGGVLLIIANGIDGFEADT